MHENTFSSFHSFLIIYIRFACQEREAANDDRTFSLFQSLHDLEVFCQCFDGSNTVITDYPTPLPRKCLYSIYLFSQISS